MNMHYRTRMLYINEQDRQQFHTIIKEAADLLKQGQVVAFPTETVYGLGANALDSKAVLKIFEAKGRPGDNPLIVHIAKQEEIMGLAASIPSYARRVMEAFWPGPLTLIFPKKERVPYETTAGLETVAIRMPNHPVAKALIEECGFPIAAPSANRSGKPSPTTAGHVLEDMNGRIPLILDGGKALVGVESTVLDVTGEVPMILRPGGITKEMLEKVLGRVDVHASTLSPLKDGIRATSPGMKYMHYSPDAEVIIVAGDMEPMTEKIMELYREYRGNGKTVGIMATVETKDRYPESAVKTVGSRHDPRTIASNLFYCLREFDRDGVDIILAEAVPTMDIGLAIMNRLGRAAGFHIIDVQ